MEEEKEVKEDVEISIRETPQKNVVKDIKFSLNTSQSGEATFVTETINGVMEAIVINTDNPIQIVISMGDTIELLRMVNFSGENYLPLRVSAVADGGENYRDSPEKWVLNNPLRFEVKGPLNTNVEFIIRYC